MAQNFLSINATYNDFSTLPSAKIDRFLLENCNSLLKKVYGFMQRSDSLLLITGFPGTGKSQVCNHLLSYIDKSVYSFKLYCTQSLTLDDVLLNLWAQFVNVASNTELAGRFMYSSSFQERVEGCFSNSDSNIVVTLYNYDLIDENNKSDILDFILTLTKNSKCKIIILSKTFDTNSVPEDLSYTKIILKAFSRIIFEKFLQERNVKATSRMFDELYKITRGYYFYTNISANILNIKELSVTNYLAAYTNSGMSFDKFLSKAYVSMQSVKAREILNFMAVMRHPINSQLLDYVGMYDEHIINELVKNSFLTKVDDLFIFNNYFSEKILEELSAEEILKVKKQLVSFYNSQLPLKPTERLLLLSRTTLRKEIEYHSPKQLPPDVLSDENNAVDAVKSFDELTDDELKSKAEQAEGQYEYSQAISCYLKLIERENSDFSIILSLARLYSKVGNWKYSLHYYNSAKDYFISQNDNDSLYKIQFAISKIYYQSYKTNDAISLLNEIIHSSDNNKLNIDAFTLLGNIYISLAEKNKAYELYHKAIILAEEETEIDNPTELYFKFAILADENDDCKSALKYYNKCITSAVETDKYIALSYSNLGDFYLDNDDKESALNNFKQAFHYDTLNNNHYGVYYSASNIAKLIIYTAPDDALKYMLKAKEAAIKSKDIFAIANSYLHLGDYFSNINDYDSALKEYFSVLSLVKDKFSNENKNKITLRIEDIKHKIGEERFNELYSNKD